jgi:predicted transcriptional regulator
MPNSKPDEATPILGTPRLKSDPNSTTELDKIAARRFTTVTEEVKQAVREYVERQAEKKG